MIISLYCIYPNTTSLHLQDPQKMLIIKSTNLQQVIYMYQTTLNSPLGLLTLASDGTSITGLWLPRQAHFPQILPEMTQPDLPVFQETAQWLEAYFSGRPLPLLPPLAPCGTSYQQATWGILSEIPYGTTTTYGAISKKLLEMGIPSSPQAVGGAVGRNPISILIPCHRVVGANGKLTGYAGGLAAKRFLLRLERIL